MPTTTPQWKLRRLAPRALRIIKRRAGTSPALAAHLSTMGPQAEAYVAAYDRVVKYAMTRKKELEEGKTAIKALLKEIRGWVPLLLRDIPGFDPSVYGDRPEVPDDVLEDGERLLSVIDEARDGKGEPLSYRQQALETLGAAVKAALKEWGEAEAADKEYQNVNNEMHVQASNLQRDLVILRRTLLATVGSTDMDYQKLRVERAGEPDDEDDPSAPSAPVIKPAAPNAAPPSNTSNP